MKRTKKTGIGPMRLLLEVHSILNTGGPYNSSEISDRLLLRGLDFTVEMLHLMLNSDAAAYFLIRRLNGTNSFEVVPQKMYEFRVGVASKHTLDYPKGPIPWPQPQMAIVHVNKTPQVEVITPAQEGRLQAKAARKEEILTFCRLKGRLPSQTIELEKSMYHFINNNKKDADFVAKLSGYKGMVGKPGPKPKYNDDTLGMQLAESGGGGSF